MCQPLTATTQTKPLGRVNTSEGGVFFDSSNNCTSIRTKHRLSRAHFSDGRLFSKGGSAGAGTTTNTFPATTVVSFGNSKRSENDVGCHSHGVLLDRKESVATTTTAETSVVSIVEGDDNDDFYVGDGATIDSNESNTGSNAPGEDCGCSWRSTGSKSFLLNAPLLVSDPEDEHADEPIPDAAQKLGLIISRSSRLPSANNQYASNHVMVNEERIRRCTAPLARLSELDAIARNHAQRMANADRGLFHMDPSDLVEQFHRPYRRMGENVAKGTSIKLIHKAMMNESISDRNNIIDRRYTHFGMGTAKSKSDDEVYLCQVFRG